MDRKKILVQQERVRAQLSRKNRSTSENAQTISLSDGYTKNEKGNYEYLSGLEPCKEVKIDEARNIVKEIQDSLKGKKLEETRSKIRKDLVHTIVVPFGLGRCLAVYDKVGGNVTTLLNFEKGIVATDEDAQRYSEWEKSKNDFDREPYDKVVSSNRLGSPVDKNFNREKKKEKYSSMAEGERLIDGYTGQTLSTKRGDRLEKNSETHLDHITSVKEIETAPGNHLFARGDTSKERQQDRVTLAQSDNNLTYTNASVNCSKGSKDLFEWGESKSKKDNSKTNFEYYGVDRQRALEEYNKSKYYSKSEQLKRQFYKQGTEVVGTGVREGYKMGFQQAVGLLLVEFFVNAFDEIKKISKADMERGSVYQTITAGLKRVVLKTSKSWKEAAYGFTKGFISGFLSNLATMLINTFVTTGKRVVRMVREGVLSLLKAVKIIVCPPKNISSQQAAHEALKLVAASGVVIGGVLLEESVEKLVLSVPLLAPIAQVLTSVIVGSITTIGMAFVTFLVDELDVFGSINAENHTSIVSILDDRIQRNLGDSKVVMREIDDILSSSLYG